MQTEMIVTRSWSWYFVMQNESRQCTQEWLSQGQWPRYFVMQTKFSLSKRKWLSQGHDLDTSLCKWNFRYPNGNDCLKVTTFDNSLWRRNLLCKRIGSMRHHLDTSLCKRISWCKRTEKSLATTTPTDVAGCRARLRPKGSPFASSYGSCHRLCPDATRSQSCWAFEQIVKRKQGRGDGSSWERIVFSLKNCWF